LPLTFSVMLLFGVAWKVSTGAELTGTDDCDWSDCCSVNCKSICLETRKGPSSYLYS
jgi:hypothetical protein